MPFEVTIDSDRRLVSVIWRGRVDEAGCAAYIEQVWSAGAVADFDELLDFRAVTDIDLTADAIQRLVSRSRSVSVPEAKARSALVASEALMYGLSRMYVSMRDLDDADQREWQVTDDYDAAVGWINAGRGSRDNA